LPKYLSDRFLEKYPDFPAKMNELGTFVYLRTYSRYIPEEGRRETWKETCKRAVEYNVGLEYKHLNKIGYKPNLQELREEAEELFDNVFNLRQFLSGRTLWVGGAETGVADKYPLANFNCSFVNIKSWDDIGDLFYLLLVGTGVGVKCTKENAAKMHPVRTDLEIMHSEYEPVPAERRLEHTALKVLDNGYAKLYIGDSKEGWVEALRYFFGFLVKDKYKHIHTIKFSYNSIRPKGERLKTFGGMASGHESLKEMFNGINSVLKNEVDPNLEPMQVTEEGKSKVRPIHILDICNLVGNNVVVGGVRRTAELFLFDPDDYECLLAKYGINGFYDEEHLKQHRKVEKCLDKLGLKPSWFNNVENRVKNLNHRRLSNNSIAFEGKPSEEYLNLIFELIKLDGEPGFINLEEAKKRRPNVEGVNPCAEVLLDSYGVCNLTTVNVKAFYNNGVLDEEGLFRAQQLSVRAGLRMTLTELEIPHWNSIQERDRLLGCSLTGVREVFNNLKEFETDILMNLKDKAYKEAEIYSKKLRVAIPLLVTTIKPEGTLSQVAGGVSSGLHYSFAPYYIRRIRINAEDPLAKTVKELGWKISPEVGTPKNKLENAETIVIDFPVKNDVEKFSSEVTAIEQLENYLTFQKYYTDHNSSNTISVRPEEWEEVKNFILEHWRDFIGVTFMPYDGGTYKLAPYEEISEKEYKELKESMKELDFEVLKKYDTGESEIETAESCEAGGCPIR